MKSKFLKKIIAVAVVGTGISTFISTDAFAVGSSDFYALQNMNNGQSSGYWNLNIGKWYYFNYSGTLQTGWIYDKGRWYYTDYSGVMQTGVVQVDGKIYLFSESGAMQTGNAVVNGNYYSFDQKGAAVGDNTPTPVNAFNTSGIADVPHTSNQIIKNEDSSPINPNTAARDPENLIKYNVKFKDDDGTEFSTKTIEKDEKLILYKPTRNGYKFVEWTTKKDGNGNSYDAGDAITIKEDITLYAQWEVSTTTDTSTGNNVLVENIIVTSSTGTITTKAGTLQMSAKVVPIDATNSGVTWSVSDSTIAEINSSGLLTAKANGTVSVVATANDTSKVVIKTSVIISGQADSQNTNTGGTTNPENLGKVIFFDSNVSLTEVVIDTEGNIVDLPLLEASGKLPTKANIICNLSDGKVKEIEMGITDWSLTETEFDGKVTGNYTLTATLGALPTGYTKIDGLPMPSATLKVIVNKEQTDRRKTITGAATISEIPLASDKHIMNTALLNASAGMLPTTVKLNYDGGTVVANVKTWNCTNADDSDFDGSQGIKKLVADIESPVGYIIGSGVSVTAKLNVITTQTLSIKELVGVVDGSVKLNYAAGDYLDLSTLAVNVKYNNDSEGEISYSDFKTYGITTSGYINGMQLKTTNSATSGIPVVYNNKTVYTGAFKVVVAASPTITAVDGNAIFNMTSELPETGLNFKYTLGTGSKTATKIDSVTLNNEDIDYTDVNNTITISKNALIYFMNGKTTPNGYTLNVTFTPEVTGTQLSSSAKIAFISAQTLGDGIISLASGTAVLAKDNTIKLLGLTNTVKYEYCVCAVNETPNWASAKSFTATGTTMEKYDANFKADAKLYIRLQAVSNNGAINPASNAQMLTLDLTNIGKTLSAEKSIKTFSLKYSTDVSCTGTIDETNGTITVIVPTMVLSDIPTVMDTSNLTANFTLSDNATVAVSGIDQTSGSGTVKDFRSPVIYTVTAQDGTTKKAYTVNIIKPTLPKSYVRSDDLYYLKTTTTTVDGVETTTTTNIKFNILNDGYEKAGIKIDSLTDGLVKITAETSVFNTDASKLALEKIRELTPYTNAQIAGVGIKVTNPYTGTQIATKVKVAGTLDGLKTATAISLSGTGTNVLEGQYLEQIPVAMYGSSAWSIVTQPIITKYYEWIDSSGNILGYTSLSIKV